MKISDINDYFLRTWKSSNPELRFFDVHQNHVVFADKELDLGNFNVQELLYNPTFSAEIGSMNAEDLFDILSVHVMEEHVASIQRKSPIIQQMKIAIQTDENGLSSPYIAYLDENHGRHVFRTGNPAAILEAYRVLLERSQTITEEDLLDYLNGKQQKKEEQKVQRDAKGVTMPSISWGEYYKMIHDERAHTPQDAGNLEEFNSFLYLLNAYGEYLTNDCKSALDQYQFQILDLQEKAEQERANANEQHALQTYYSFMDRMENKKIATDAMKQEMGYTKKLVKKETANSGRITFAVILLLVANVVIHIMFLFLLKVL